MTTPRDTEQDFDRFSTLFSPSTPRASPTLDATIPPPITSFSHRPPKPHTKNPSADSDFGAFVSVSEFEDPLSSTIAEFELDQLPPPMKPSPQPPHSLQFFDKFAQDAKKSLERRRSVLEELLMHEDEPMYWLKAQKDEEQPEPIPAPPSQDEQPESPEPNSTEAPHPLPADKSPQMLLLHDLERELDLEFFTNRKPIVRRVSNPSSPTRSPTAPAPPTLAPPIASRPIIINPLSSSPPYGSTARPHTSPGHSSSSQSIRSTLPSRWMSSILRSNSSSGGSSPLPGARPSLESVFSQSRSQGQSPVLTHQALHPHTHAHTEPQPIAPKPITLTHGNPFAPSIKSHASPFATHVFKPISGAPGFTGDKYDWDKGFSQDLEREMIVGRMGRRGGSQGKGEEGVFGFDGEEEDGVGGVSEDDRSSKASSREASRGGVGLRKKVGTVIDERLGGVQLVGRKASTQPVLSGPLAELIRTHLPALARLPRTWSLLYSLDQHGISLNTLYSNCERAAGGDRDPKNRIAGELVVVRDAGGAVFGVWLGEEGVRMSRGRGYYGSGESFLWKFNGEKLDVYKWTGRNDYVALCEPEFISFGGGDGHYGLYLDENLTDGSSAACPTFGNPPLCSLGPKKAGSVDFECEGLEVWGCGP